MRNMHRRDFLAAAGSIAAVTTCRPSKLTAHSLAAGKKMPPVIDTHLHCFAGKDDARFPYHARAPYQPDGAATPEHLLKCMDGAGVDYAIVVHPEPYQDDHRYLEHCLNANRKRLKGTCLFFADRPGSIQKMPALVRKFPDHIVAARIHAFRKGRIPKFGTPELRNLWKTAADLGLAVQLHFEPRHAPGFEPYIKEFKQTNVIIDHMGRPYQGTQKEHAVVVRWARFPNTYMKVASLPAKDPGPPRTLGTVIKTLTNAFGADRMIHGGGFNGQATGESYRAYHERVASLLTHLSPADRAKLLGGTAQQLFKFGKS